MGNQSSITHIVSGTEDFYVYSAYGASIASSMLRLTKIEEMREKEHELSLERIVLAQTYSGQPNDERAGKVYDYVFYKAEESKIPGLDASAMSPIAHIEVNEVTDTYKYKSEKQGTDFEVPLRKAKVLAKNIIKQIDAPDISYTDFSKQFEEQIENYREKHQMRIVVVEPGKPAYEHRIEKGLHAKQSIVGGLIEPISFLEEQDAIIIRNDEARLMELEPNRTFKNIPGPLCHSTVCGTFFICGDNGEEFTSLTKQQADKYVKQFAVPDKYTERQREEALQCQSGFVEFSSSLELLELLGYGIKEAQTPPAREQSKGGRKRSR